jgi:RNA polymerase sigma-70 factor (ECF subfamily)
MGSTTTCWTVIRGVAAGDDADRQAFAQRYQGVVRAYLLARWQGSPLLQEVDDALQEVFVESFREGGVLDKVDDQAPGGFRAFLYGVARNVALRHETKRGRRRDKQMDTAMSAGDALSADETRLSQVFDRHWATTIMREAAERQRADAGDDEAALLLRLRFHDGLPIREIAARWQQDPVHVHRAYAKARKEFKRALLEVIAFHRPGSPEIHEQECAQLLAMLE